MKCVFCGLPTTLHFVRCTGARDAGLPDPPKDFVNRKIELGPYEWMRTKTRKPVKTLRDEQ